MKILITGGTGFLGSALVEELIRENHEIKVLTRSRVKLAGVKTVRGDIRSFNTIKNAFENAGAVYHLAAIIDETAPKEVMWDVNVKGTANVLRGCVKYGVPRLVFTSTTGVMGPNIKESEGNYNPETYYEETKAEAERLVLSSKLNAIVLRPTILYGLNSYWKKIIQKAEEGFPIIGSGENYWHLLYVKNAVNALKCALKHGKAHSPYIIADAEALTYKNIYNVIRENLGKPPVKRHIPVKVALGLAALCGLKSKICGGESIVSPQHIKRLIRNRKYDIKKAEKELKYRPKYSTQEGLREIIEGYRNTYE